MTDPTTDPTTDLDIDLRRARTWLANAEAVLLTAGAGLTAAAGIDYTDTAAFTRLFPAFARKGYRAQYEMIGRPLPQDQLWGYWLTHVQHVRFDPAPNPLYGRLRAVVGDTEHFVLTSNVDALFARNGFDAGQVWTPQGDYAYYQCTVPCTRQVWDTQDLVRDLLPTVDPATGAVQGNPPQCPNCGEHVWLNVRIDSSFIGDHFESTGNALSSWLHERRDRRVVVLEMGAGYNTPMVVRWPGESVAAAFPQARLIRINPTHPDVPAELGERALGLPTDATTAIDAFQETTS